MRCNADLILARTLANAQENETVEYKDRKNLSKDDVGKYFSHLGIAFCFSVSECINSFFVHNCYRYIFYFVLRC